MRVKLLDKWEILLETSEKLVTFAQAQFLINEEDRDCLSEPATEAEAFYYIDEYCRYLEILKDEVSETEDAVTTLELTEEDVAERLEQGFELDDAISEAISNKTGFCHTGFSYKIVVTTTLDKTEG